MSKLSDYSKFDHLDEEEEEASSSPVEAIPTKNAETAAGNVSASTPRHNKDEAASAMRKNPETGRYIFEHGGQTIYEWEQTLDDVSLYISPPPFVQQGSDIVCTISAKRLQLKLRAQAENEFYLNHEPWELVDVDESTWSLESSDSNPKEKVIVVYLTKAQRGIVWDAALKPLGGSKGGPLQKLDPSSREQEQQKLLLERFQEENPHMDFSGASFNGSAPDPRSFMDGINYR